MCPPVLFIVNSPSTSDMCPPLCQPARWVRQPIIRQFSQTVPRVFTTVSSLLSAAGSRSEATDPAAHHLCWAKANRHFQSATVSQTSRFKSVLSVCPRLAGSPWPLALERGPMQVSFCTPLFPEPHITALVLIPKSSMRDIIVRLVGHTDNSYA